jgi:tetratricopeptide (TPR) repeat protein
MSDLSQDGLHQVVTEDAARAARHFDETENHERHGARFSDTVSLSTEELFEHADDLGTRGAWCQAAAVLSLAAMPVDEDVHTHFRVAYCFLRGHVHEEALAIADKIITVNYRHAGALAIRAAALLGLRRVKEAREALNTAFNYGPDDALVRAVGARVLCVEGHHDAAAKMMAQCLAISPKDGYVLDTVFYLSRRQPNTVVDLLPRDYATPDADGWRRIGEALAAEGIEDAASYAFRQAIERCPTDQLTTRAIWSLPGRAAFRPVKVVFAAIIVGVLLLGAVAAWIGARSTFIAIDALLGVTAVFGFLPISVARMLEQKGESLPDATRPWMWIRSGAFMGTFLLWMIALKANTGVDIFIAFDVAAIAVIGGRHFLRWRKNVRKSCDPNLVPWRDELELQLMDRQLFGTGIFYRLFARAGNVKAPAGALRTKITCRCEKLSQLNGPLATRYLEEHLTIDRHHVTGIATAVCPSTRLEWLSFPLSLTVQGAPESIVRV